MSKRFFAGSAVVVAALSIAAANPASPKESTDTLDGFCKALDHEGIGVHPGLTQMRLEFGLLETNYHRMKAARAEANSMESSQTCSEDLKADAKRRAFESERAFREDVNSFGAKFAK